MRISQNDWKRYRDKLKNICQEAQDEFVKWTVSEGGFSNIERQRVIAYAYALCTKYGESEASLAALMYEATAEASGVTVPAAEVAGTATYEEVAKTINGIAQKSSNDNYVGGGVYQLVKQAGADTSLKNAKRDGAEFAWIPSGDTCVYCLSIAANGWKKADSKSTGKADHIHNNCDCTFAVRFNSETNVQGYDPQKYKDIYDSAPGKSSTDKLNYLRREQYAENKDAINEQKRIAYALRNNK